MSSISVITARYIKECHLRALIGYSAERFDGKINGNTIIVPTEKTAILLSTLNDAGISYSYVSKHSPGQDNEEAMEKEYEKACVKTKINRPMTKRERVRRLKGLDRIGA